MKKTQSDPAAGKIWNRRFTAVFLASCILYLGLNTMMSMVPKLANTMTDSASLVGLVSSAFAVAALLLKIVAGPATDTFSKKRVIQLAALLMAIAFFGFSLSRSIQMLIVFRLLQGAAQAFTAIALLAFASDCLPKDKLTSGIGIYSLGQTATQALAPAFGLWLADAFGYPVMCAVCGALVLSASIVTGMIPDDFVRSKPFRITLRGIAVREALIPALVMGLLVMTYSMVSSYLLIYADVQGVAGIGVFFTVQACAMLISRPLTSRLADRFGTVSVLLPALLLFGGAYFLLSGAAALPVYLAAAVAIGFGYGACQPLIQALCIKCAGPDRRGSASNTNYLGFDLGNMLGPILAGRLIDLCGYAQTWKFMTIPIAAALVVLLCWRRQANAIEGRS